MISCVLCSRFSNSNDVQKYTSHVPWCVCVYFHFSCLSELRQNLWLLKYKQLDYKFRSVSMKNEGESKHLYCYKNHREIINFNLDLQSYHNRSNSEHDQWSTVLLKSLLTLSVLMGNQCFAVIFSFPLLLCTRRPRSNCFSYYAGIKIFGRVPI